MPLIFCRTFHTQDDVTESGLCLHSDERAMHRLALDLLQDTRFLSEAKSESSIVAVVRAVQKRRG